MARLKNDVDIERVAFESARFHRVLSQHHAQYNDAGYQKGLGCMGAALVAQQLNLLLEDRDSLQDPPRPVIDLGTDARAFCYPVDVEIQIDVIRGALPKLLQDIGYDDLLEWLGRYGKGVPLPKKAKRGSEGRWRELDALKRAVDALDGFIKYANGIANSDKLGDVVCIPKKSGKPRGRQPKGVLKDPKVREAIDARLDSNKLDQYHIAKQVQEQTGIEVKASDVKRRDRTRKRRPSRTQS